jgi:hypothetical protein
MQALAIICLAVSAKMSSILSSTSLHAATNTLYLFSGCVFAVLILVETRRLASFLHLLAPHTRSHLYAHSNLLSGMLTGRTNPVTASNKTVNANSVSLHGPVGGGGSVCVSDDSYVMHVQDPHPPSSAQSQASKRSFSNTHKLPTLRFSRNNTPENNNNVNFGHVLASDSSNNRTNMDTQRDPSPKDTTPPVATPVIGHAYSSSQHTLASGQSQHIKSASNSARREEEQFLELKHMIANTAHDLKTVCSIHRHCIFSLSIVQPLSAFMNGIELAKAIIGDMESRLDYVPSHLFAQLEAFTLDMREDLGALNAALHNMASTNSFMLMSINRFLRGAFRKSFMSGYRYNLM